MGHAVEKKSVLIPSTPVLDTNIYASGDMVTAATELVGAMDDSGGGGELFSLAIVDQAKQKAALKVLFFKSAPTIASALNAALDITDAEMAAKFLGSVDVAAASYVDISGSSFITLVNLGLMLRAAVGFTSIWYVILSAGSPTYTASDLILKFGIRQD